MGVTAALDNIPRGAWIALLVVSFVLFWPIGLGLLIYLKWSGRMGCWKHRGADHWRQRAQENMQRWYRAQGSSGNRAFDEYRDETLRRLEEEQKEFKDFLERLRHAKDKAEFDQFMADRRQRGEPGPAPEPQT